MVLTSVEGEEGEGGDERRGEERRGDQTSSTVSQTSDDELMTITVSLI